MRPDAERELRRLRALYDLATAMTGDNSLEKNLQLLVDMSRELLGTDTAYLALLSRDKETLVVEACSGVRSEGFNRLRLPAAARGALLPPGPGKSAAKAQNCLEPGGEPAFEILAAEGLLGGLQAPVVSHDHVLGYLFVADRRKSVYTREDQDTLILIANLAAVEVSRKRSEKALEENSERLRAVFQNATDAIFIKDLDLRYLMANGAVEDLLRVPPVEIIGKTDEQILDAESAARSRGIEERVLAGQVLEEEFTRKRNGDTAFFHLVRAPLKDPSGAVRGLCGIGRDITALKRLEAGARQASKMEAIDTFSTGIAHDFNNILGIISVNVGMAAQALGEKDPIRRNLDLIREACSRGRDLVRQILRLSAGLEEEKKPVRLSSLLEESIRLLRSSAPPSVEIQSKIRTTEDRVLGDPSQLQQAFINLGANALYAMRETGGLLTVTLEDALLQGGGPEYSPCLNSGRHLRICFEDTGPGMADDVLERAFDPYFTTKPKGEASGMGLSIARGIVKGHGGAIEVKNLAEGGCLFQVLIPAYAGVEEEAGQGSPAGAAANACVLLVDDEPGIITGVSEMLERLGYKVVSETDPRSALKTFERHADDFDLIITDMTMPGFTGEDLIREIRRIRPTVPVLLCTGYNEKIAGKSHEQLGIKGLLLKPFAVEELARKIRTVLGETAA